MVYCEPFWCFEDDTYRIYLSFNNDFNNKNTVVSTSVTMSLSYIFIILYNKPRGWGEKVDRWGRDSWRQEGHLRYFLKFFP